MFETGRLVPQTLLKQRYRIEGVVGRGGMGAVYRALDTQAESRLVAVKEMSQLHLSEAESAAAGARFLSEAALLGSLTHPGLPRVYEAFREQGRLYLVMDFIEGKTLFQLLKEAGGQPLPVGQVLAYADQLCSVLAYLHQHQPPIIFRDLKPANVIITASEQVFLIDFGIARLFKTGQPQDTLFLGSPGYAPPEQHGLSQTNPRSDLYSLGVTLYACLTARDPASASADQRFFFPPLRQYNWQVPEDLDALVQRLVAVEEKHRPGSALEVQQALRQIRQRGVEPTERLAPPLPTLPPVSPAALGSRSTFPISALDAGQSPAQPLPGLRNLQAASASLWMPSFSALFGLLLALTIGGSIFAFNVIPGSDHLVEGSVLLLFLLVLLGTALVTQTPLAWGILGLAGSASLVACFALLEQAVQGQLASTLSASTLNQLLTGGLAGAALGSLLWLARPFSWGHRLTLVVVFGAPLLCALLQYPDADTEVAKHILLLISGISLIQGGLLAAQMERLRLHRTAR